MFPLRMYSSRGAFGALNKAMRPQQNAMVRLSMPQSVRGLHQTAAAAMYNPQACKTHEQNDQVLLKQLQESINSGGGFNDSNLKYRWALQICEKHQIPEAEIEAALDDAVDSETPDTHEINVHVTGPGKVSFILACFTQDTERTKAGIAEIVKTFKGAKMGEKPTTDIDDEDAERFAKRAHIVVDPKRRDSVDGTNMNLTDQSFQRLIHLVHGTNLSLESTEIAYGEAGRCLKVAVAPDNFYKLMGLLDEDGRVPEEATLEWVSVPHNEMFIMGQTLRGKIENFKKALGAHEDVAQVCHNAEFGDDNKDFSGGR